MQHGTTDERELVRTCIENGDEQHFDAILMAIKNSGAFDYIKCEAEKAVQSATSSIASLPASPAKDSLLQLCAFAVARNS